MCHLFWGHSEHVSAVGAVNSWLSKVSQSHISQLPTICSTISARLTKRARQTSPSFLTADVRSVPPDPVSYYNPLHIAVLRNRPSMVRLLVSRGADVEKRDRVREPPHPFVSFLPLYWSPLTYLSLPARSTRAVPWIWPVRSQTDSPACSPCWTWALMSTQKTNAVSCVGSERSGIPNSKARSLAHSLPKSHLWRKNAFAPRLGQQRRAYGAQHGEHPAAAAERSWLWTLHTRKF